MQRQKIENELYVYNNKEVEQKWSATAKTYQRFDSCMQTGYYTLVNMLKLHEAKNILEIACGSGRLLPYALTLKHVSSAYLATDISQTMVQMSREYLRQYILNFGIGDQLQTWLQKQKLRFLVHNGEEPLPIADKFDRIICNFVFHLTESPEKMLKNLFNSAESGCLMGVSVNGSIDESNILAVLRQVKKELNIAETRRSYAFLYNNFGELAKRAGWEVILCWEQIMPFNFLQVDESFDQYLRQIIQLPQNQLQMVRSKIQNIFQQKKGIKLSAQLYICKKP